MRFSTSGRRLDVERWTRGWVELGVAQRALPSSSMESAEPFSLAVSGDGGGVADVVGCDLKALFRELVAKVLCAGRLLTLL